VDSDLTFHQIVDGISALITVTTPDGQVEVVNRQVLDYFGKSLDELKEWTATDAVHPDDLPGVIAAWQRAPARSTVRAGRWFVLHADIDERKRAEALLAGEKRLLEMVAAGHALPAVLVSWSFTT
jgi:PAS domain-containing protein